MSSSYVIGVTTSDEEGGGGDGEGEGDGEDDEVSSAAAAAAAAGAALVMTDFLDVAGCLASSLRAGRTSLEERAFFPSGGRWNRCLVRFG